MIEYHRVCNHCGVAYKCPAEYLRHCEAQALATGHGKLGTPCPEIKFCPWVRYNVAPLEWSLTYKFYPEVA